ncbi:MAG: Cna B-type domain-containing protein [Acutalibacteraceae bacterium]
MVKKVFKKALSCMLSVCVLAGTMLLTAQAVPDQNRNQIGNYVTVDSDNHVGSQESGTGTSTVTGADGVEIQKNIAPVLDANGNPIENLFDITLQVKTQQTVISNDAAIAMVIDVSGSMDYCAECGNENRHDQNCKYYSKKNNTVTTAQSRMQATISGAKNFVDSIASSAAEDEHSGRIYVSVIKFSSSASKVCDWIDITTAQGLASVKSYLEGLSANGGTNLEAGLMLARNRLNMTAAPVGGKAVNISALNKFTVLLTDGQPTFRVVNNSTSTEAAGTDSTGNNTNDNNGSGTSKAERNEAKDMATQVKALSKLYTICYGVSGDALYTTYQDVCVHCGKPESEHTIWGNYCPDGSWNRYEVKGTTVTIGDYLKDEIATAATADNAYAYNAGSTDELNAAFAKIASSTTSGINAAGAVVNDPMGDVVVFQTGTALTGNSAADAAYDSDSETLVWTLDAENASVNTVDGTTTYTYTITYRVELDTANLQPDTYYPTNKYTTLTWGTTTMAFKVPTVKGIFADFSFDKVAYHDNSIGLNDAVFTMVRSDGAVTRTSSSVNGAVLFENLPSGTYTLTETTAATGYDKDSAASYTVIVAFGQVTVQGVSGALTVTNKLLQKKISVSGQKTWVDGSGSGRPASITVILLRDNVEAARTTVTAQNNWKYSFTDLDQIDLETGRDYVYTVQEAVPAGYDQTVSGNDITNTLQQKKITVSGVKTWVDGGNALNTRPASVTLELFANGKTTGKTVTTEASKQWKYSFTDLDQYDAARYPIVYTVQERNVDSDYTATVGTSANNYEVKNIIKQEKITVSGTKVWVDGDNAGNTRPASVTVELYANNAATGSRVVTAQSENWSYQFTQLDKFDANGAVIVYTVKEVNTDSLYTATDGTAGNQYTVTNTIKQQKTSVSVRKEWVVPNGMQKPAVVISLNNGSQSVATVTLDGVVDEKETTAWQYTFANLDVYDLTTGAAINYTVSESALSGYNNGGSPAITGSMKEGFVVTNTLDQEKITISGTKTWVDNNNAYGTRPNTITFNLYRGNHEFVTSATVSNTATGYSFANLDRYDANRQPYTYTVEEAAVDNYTTTTDASGLNFTNTIKQESTSVSVNKVWVAPESLQAAVTISLKQNGTAIANITLDGTTDEKEITAWQYTFSNLPVYDLTTGAKYAYTVEETTQLQGFNAPVITGSAANGFTVTNTVTQKYTTVSGTKTWVDGNDTSLRPANITFTLYRDGAKTTTTQSIANTAAGYQFTNLPVYAPDGHEYRYTVEEEVVAGYDSEKTVTDSGINFINTIQQAYTSVSVNKVWVAPESLQAAVTISLKQNGTAIANITLDGTTDEKETTAWQYTFSNLPVYDLTTGAKYAYTVEETTQLADFDAPVVTGSAANGFTVTNAVAQKYTGISGTKTWVDPEGTVHPTITINLLRDGTVYQSVQLANGETDYSFAELPVYALDNNDAAQNDGHRYAYTVEEAEVDGYNSEKDDDNNFINIIEQEMITVSGTKTWIDAPADEALPEVTIVLSRDGEEIARTVMNTELGWSYAFAELDRYDLTDGHEYEYTVAELPVEGYTTEQDGYDFFNTYEEEIPESEPPLVGPSSEPEESIPDNDIPFTGGMAMAGGALGVFAAAALAAVVIGKRKREEDQ